MKVKTFIFGLTFLFILSSCAPREIKPPEKIPVAPPKPAKIALVLGAGAAKGFAHIGVLKMLTTHKIPIHMVVGTSAGSLVGCFYAYGYSPFEMQSLALSMQRADIIDFIIPDNGFIQGLKLAEFVNKMTKNTPLEKMPLPFYAVATDLQSGQEVVFGKGDTGTAVRASCSIPGVFRPVRIGDRLFVDGGLVSPVAVEAAHKYGADFVIAVDVSSDLGNIRPESTIETILQAVNIMYSKMVQQQLAKADVVIRPKVGHISSSDFAKRHEAILEGEKATLEVLPKIKEIVERLRQEKRLSWKIIAPRKIY